MGEFELIRRFFQPLYKHGNNPALLLGPGDDAAIQRVPDGHELVFSVDTLVEGAHFPPHYGPEKLGWRSLAAAASDLAAMGANPVCFTLALTLPQADTDWLQAFSTGLAEASRQFGLTLAGGDTTRGPLVLTIQVHGELPASSAIRRSGARPGDLICVSGTLGDAGAALDLLDVSSPSAQQASLLERYHRPQPRLELGQSLRGHASAGIDISDGLVADLGHLLAASGSGGRIEVERLPLSAAIRALRPDATDLALYAGDDYELCVTMPESAWLALPATIRDQLTVIGQVYAGAGIELSGGRELPRGRGYDHFGGME